MSMMNVLGARARLRPSYSLDFMGTLPAGLTYTNSTTTRYYWNSSGNLTTAAANAAIFEYNPLTLALLGMRWEMEARTNNVFYSSEDNAVWTDVNSTHSPSGTSVVPSKTPILITASASATGRLQQVLTTLTGSNECVWAILEQGTSAGSRVRLWDQTAGATVCDSAITWSTEVISGTGSFGGVKLKATGPNGGKLFLLYAYAAGTGGNSKRIFIYPDTAAGVNTCYLHHAQLEAGTYPSSPIVTAGAAASRTADALSLGTLGSWFNNVEGTFLFEGICSDFGATRGLFSINDNTLDNRVAAYMDTSRRSASIIISGGANQGQPVTTNAATAGSVFKAVNFYKANSFGSTINGGAAIVDTAATIPTVSQLNFGVLTHTLAGPFMGHTRYITYFPIRFSDSEARRRGL